MHCVIARYGFLSHSTIQESYPIRVRQSSQRLRLANNQPSRKPVATGFERSWNLEFFQRIPPPGSAHPPSLRVLSVSVCIFDLSILFRVCTSSAVFSLLCLSRILWKSHGTAEGAILVHCCIVPPIFFVFLAMKSFTRRCGPCRSPGFASGV